MEDCKLHIANCKLHIDVRVAKIKENLIGAKPEFSSGLDSLKGRIPMLKKYFLESVFHPGNN